MEKELKYRHEYKYICTDDQIEIIKNRLNNLLKLDSNIIKENTYNIRSLYLDDYYNTGYYENESGVDPREKFRIRIYNKDSTRINLELKKKENSKTLKESTKISLKVANDIINNKLKFEDTNHRLLKKLWILNKTKLLRPVIIVEYDRIPYICKEGNVRITIDKNISSSKYINKFFEKTIPKRPINRSNIHILEIKFDEFLPDYIYNSLDLGRLQRTEFSKYYLCRKYTL